MLAESLNSAKARTPPSVGDEEKAWRALDEVLRRLVGHLCVAARGQSVQLDAQLKRVASALRRRAPADEVEGMFADLHRAIVALDDVAPEPQRAAEPSPFATAAGYLLRLLDRLALQNRVGTRVDEIRSSLAAAASDTAIAEALERMADLVNDQLQAFQRDRGEVERTLAQVNHQLDEVAAYLFGEDADRDAAQQSSHEMQGQVGAELAGLGACVQQAVDLEGLRRDVVSRTDAIHRHMVDFRERESTRMAAYQERAERMRARIGELERETRSLQESLHREKRLSATDALTGIPNRLAWDERIAHEYARWKRFSRPMCLVAWDIDHFKAINDGYGHAAGDKVLYVVAQHLQRGVREVDFVARYGGEEFAMLLLGTLPEDALKVCNGLRERIAKLNFHFRQKPIPVTVSCGIAAFADEDTPEAVFERADLAMYRAKREGRNACMLA